MGLLCEDVPIPLLESHLIMISEAISAIECLVQLAQPQHSNFITNLLFMRKISDHNKNEPQ